MTRKLKTETIKISYGTPRNNYRLDITGRDSIAAPGRGQVELPQKFGNCDGLVYGTLYHLINDSDLREDSELRLPFYKLEIKRDVPLEPVQAKIIEDLVRLHNTRRKNEEILLKILESNEQQTEEIRHLQGEMI